jgi:hypothetical protein
MFYLMAQKALRPKTWYKEIFYLPILLALGIGMSVNNAKAVIEALCNHQSGFVRTPKYGIGEGKANSSSQAKSSRYKTMKSMMPIIELAFAVFFGVVVVSNFIDADYVTAVLLCPFPIGFFYTSVPSLYRMLPISRKNEEGAIVDKGK